MASTAQAPKEGTTTQHAAALEARGLALAGGDKLLVPALSFEVGRGEMVALIGPSGAGKTTLLRGLAGADAPYEGQVFVDGHPVEERITDVGFVPSGDVLHDELTVGEELYFAASLRTSGETTPSEREERVMEALRDLRMENFVEARIGTLSQGQRRRIACAVELLGRPRVLIFDEPTSGLDPGLERQVMELLRRLADEGRGIVVATHTTISLHLCDRVVVMAEGGELKFAGPPSEVPGHFGVETLEDVYPLLWADEEPDDQHRNITGSKPRRGRRATPEVASVGTQVRVLTQRVAITRARDVRAMLVLLGQAPILGFAIAVVLPRNVLDSNDLGAYFGVLLAFMLLVASTWLGTITSCSQIVAEKTTIRREGDVGVSSELQLIARCAVVLPLVALECLLLSLVVTAMQPVSGGAGAVILTCVASGCSSACIGLWLSAWSDSRDQATSSVPLILIPQMLLCGALIPVERLAVPLKVISDITIGRWGFQGIGAAMNLDDTLGSNLAGVTGLDGVFFNVGPGGPIAVMAIIGVVALGGAAFSLRRAQEL